MPGAIDQLPHLTPLPWESSKPWAGYKLEAIDHRAFKNFPMMGLKSGSSVVGVACYIETLQKVIVYTVKDFFICEEKYKPGSTDRMSVQNIIVRQEAEAIQKLLMTHYEKKPCLSQKDSCLPVCPYIKS